MVTELLHRHAVERADRLALVTRDERWDYGELAERVERLAAGLWARGTQAGEPVALLLPNSTAFVVGFLALARLGAVAVLLSADLKETEVRSALTIAGCRTVLTHGRFASLARGLVRSGSLRWAFVDEERESGLPRFEGLLEEGSGRFSRPLPAADTDVLRQFTSGTTGQAKQIARTHLHLLREAEAFGRAAATGPDDRVLALVPLSHAHGLSNGLIAALRAGATLVLQERFDRRETLRLLTEERITLFPAVPFILSILADTRTEKAPDLSALRLCFAAGAPLREEVWAKIKDRLGIQVRQLYGSTETGALTLNMDVDVGASRQSVGRPLPGVEVAILDEAGRLLPPGAEGEVVVRSPAAAERCFGPEGVSRLADAEGWIRLGDLGRLDPTGRLFLTGRKALLINVAGRKVNPAEVEAVLATHPKVREAVVVGARDPYGEEAVKAVVVASTHCTPDDIILYCRDHLSNHKVPRFVEFRNVIPRCPAGKILRSELLDQPVTP